MSEGLNFKNLIKEKSISENDTEYQGNVTFVDGVPQYDLDLDSDHIEENQELLGENKESQGESQKSQVGKDKFQRENKESQVGKDKSQEENKGSQEGNNESEKKELSDREANEKELIEIQKFVKLVMRTIMAVIIDVVAIVLTITCHVKNLFLIALLASATILIAFYVYAIFVKIKEKKQAKENDAKKK